MQISWQEQRFRKAKCKLHGRRSTFARSGEGSVAGAALAQVRQREMWKVEGYIETWVAPPKPFSGRASRRTPARLEAHFQAKLLSSPGHVSQARLASRTWSPGRASPPNHPQTELVSRPSQARSFLARFASPSNCARPEQASRAPLRARLFGRASRTRVPGVRRPSASSGRASLPGACPGAPPARARLLSAPPALLLTLIAREIDKIDRSIGR